MSGTSDLQPCDHQQDTDNQDLVLEALGKCVQRGTDTLRLVTKEHSLLESLAATVNAIGAYVKALKTSTAGSSTARCGTSSAAGYGDRYANISKLLDDPYAFEDFRGAKTNGNVVPGHPDFKSMDGAVAIWLDNTNIPASLREHLNSLPSDMPQGTPAARYKRKWEALLANPSAYEDMRPYKMAVPNRHTLPDFRLQGSLDRSTAIWLDHANMETEAFLDRLAMCQAPPTVLHPDA